MAVTALVRDVFERDVGHGPYAIATSDEVQGSITFSLRQSVWQEDDLPSRGVYVVLSDLRKCEGGWRALSGRFLQPTDEQPVSHKQSKGNRKMMTTKKTKPQPFLTTHVANIALNKQIGLVFFMQNAQSTSGLTEISHESLNNDQLFVGSWMIESFVPYTNGDEDSSEDSVAPWEELEPFDIATCVDKGMAHDPPEMERLKKVVEAIDAERVALGDKLWDKDHQPAIDFLRKLVAQIDECVSYTTKRIEAVRLCHSMDSSDPMSLMRSLTSHGPEMGRDIVQGFGGLGADAMGALGYLMIKNVFTPPMIFGQRLLRVVRAVVEEKAVKEGYTSPVAD